MKKTKIIFLILPQTHLLDLAGPDQVFHEAIELGAPISVAYCGMQPAIPTSSRLSIASLQSFKHVKVNKGDYIIIPGASVDYLVGRNIPRLREMEKWIREALERGANLCSICTGAFFLARLGLLDGRKCTTHWKRTAQLKRLFPHIHLMEDILFTEDRQIYTSAGVTAGIDLALFILGKLMDDHFAFKVARELVVYTRRKGDDTQQSVFMSYRNHIHSGIHKVQDYLHDNIRQKLTLVNLSDIAFMSSRNLTRIFKKETGVTINEYVTIIRKEYLRKLSHNPDITRKQMAMLCGLKSERQVIRLLQAS